MATVSSLSEATSATTRPSRDQALEPTQEKTVLPAPKQASTTTTPDPDPGKVASGVRVIGKIIEERVNLRSAPSTNAEIIGKVERDDQVTLTGRSADGKWYQAKIAGTPICWIFGETLKITEGDPAALPLAAVKP